MFEVIFLWSLALVWLIFATIQDIKSREIANWLSFSLIIFALAFRFFYSLFVGLDFSFFYFGLIGFAIFFVLGNLFYYSHLFAGGDSKLMYALGAILPIYSTLALNLRFFLYFILVLLFLGSLYGILASIIFGLKNRKKTAKEFKKQLKKNKILFRVLIVFSIALLFLGFLSIAFFYFGIFIFVYAYLIIYAKSIDEGCMVRKTKTSKLTEGDWLFENVKIGNKIIKKSWDGLLKKDIKLLKKYKKEVLIRYGIQFGPVFLISFILMALFYFLWSIF